MKVHAHFVAMATTFVLAPALSPSCSARLEAVQGRTLARDVIITSRSADSELRRDQLAAGTLRNFDLALDTISERFKVAIIAEGAPLHATLTESQLVDLEAHLRRQPLDAQTAVARIADFYDYDSELGRNGVYLLRKRYTNPNDLPCVSYDELVHALHEIHRLTSIYVPVTPQAAHGTGRTDSPLTIFAASLRPEQLLAAHHGIWAGELDPDQQNLAVRAAAWTMLNSKASSVLAALNHLVILQDPQSRFTWMNLLNRDAFGYEGPFGKSGKVLRFPLSSNFRSHVGGSFSIGDTRLNASASIDPTLPTAEDTTAANAVGVGSNPFTVSLRTAVLAATPTASGNPTKVPTPEKGANRTRLSVEQDIADKPLSVFGLKYCNEDQRIRSIVALYGLKLFAFEGPTYSVKLPVADVSSTITDLPAQITRLVPLPLVRAVESQIATYASKMTPTPLKDSRATEDMQRRHAQLEAVNVRAKVIGSAADEIYYAAVRRALVLAEPAVPSPASSSVPVMLLTSEVLRAISIAMVSGDTVSDLLSLSNMEIPTFLESPAMLNVVVGYKEGVSVTAGFGESDPKHRDGNNAISFGISVVAGRPKAPSGVPVISP